ncbi:MAG: tRNA pseudouridine(38-40) synthase TruA [Bacteroidales bacterium]
MDTTLYRYFIRLSYLGHGFHGWQKQSKAPTIQEKLEEVLSTLLREEVRTMGAGRTDTGVHAETFYAHFDTSYTPEVIESIQLVFKANRMLPSTIAIQDIFHVPPKAHTRFDAISRTYHYYICTRKDPFWASRAWFYDRPMDITALQDTASILFNHNDFACFSKTHTQVKTTLCDIYAAEWQVYDHILCFRIEANRFLRNMVRAIVGTMTDAGLGKISTADFDRIIQSKDRCQAGYSAPAQGLYLMDIRYPDQLFF